MNKNDPLAPTPTPRPAASALLSAWLIPEVPPPFWRAALAAIVATLAALGMRFALLGPDQTLGATQAFFPAMVLVTLYAGWRWGLVPIASGAALGWWLWAGRYADTLSEPQTASMVLYLVSATATTAVAHGMRAAVIGLAEARRRQQDAETRLDVTQAAAGVGPWEWDVATGALLLSPAARRNLRLPLEGPLDFEQVASAVHPEDRHRVQEEIRRAIKSGPLYEVEYRLVDGPDGERWIHGLGRIERDAAGRAVRVLGVNFEVTKRRQAEEGLRESEARFRALADSAPALMWITGMGGSREFVNAAYVDFAGADYRDALTLDWRTRIHPEDLPTILRAQIAGEASRKPFSLEARYRRPDGQWRWLKSFSQPRYGPGGSFAGFIGIAFDVSDAKEAEAKLTGMNELLADKVDAAVAERDLAQAALSQAQKLEAIGQLTGGVAHDFNNLLTVVIGALDAVQRHPDDARRRDKMIDAAMTAARRGEKLTQHLLAFARRQPLNPEICRVDRLIAESEALLRRAVGEVLPLKLSLGSGTRTARIDAGQFEAALLNLVVNARDASPPGGAIVVESGPETLDRPRGELKPGAYLRVAVRDEGKGMDADTIARAFEPFFTTKASGKGTGLGLSQVYGFVRQSGGEVEIASKPGQGTTVSLLLPASHEGAILQAAPVAPPAPRPGVEVLLAEDDVEVGDLVEAMLIELGHNVRRAGDADEALSMARAHPDLGLLLTDVMMPGDKSGVDLASILSAERPELPILLSSGYTGQELAEARAAPWPLLRKPYALDALVRAIDQAFETRRPH
ncbi:hybrid sensor histidine kinase/response regulator [Caulobacter radicis]|uniref:histidine kinase n=1 Tax=Caulobacter radicis TaxID=2172650 RepID=A0A2T9JU96_9CAUL|nr:PAS domain-containing sensor histidine kinase [Caulobacter radicis]PVM87264.1 hybrid sensor histidine kinase/response regulator [Caulobacter radicis]